MDYKEFFKGLFIDCKPEIKGLATKVLLKGFFQILEAAVAKSDTKIDDMVLAALEPAVKAELAALIEKL